MRGFDYHNKDVDTGFRRYDKGGNNAPKKRMWRRIDEHPSKETIASYRGMLGHGNAFTLQKELPDLQQ